MSQCHWPLNYEDLKSSGNLLKCFVCSVRNSKLSTTAAATTTAATTNSGANNKNNGMY